MRAEKVASIVWVINRLTLDEDERQELWVRYLEYGEDDIADLLSYLARIRKEDNSGTKN